MLNLLCKKYRNMHLVQPGLTLQFFIPIPTCPLSTTTLNGPMQCLQAKTYNSVVEIGFNLEESSFWYH